MGVDISSVCAVTVTYGERGHLVAKVIEELSNTGVSKIVVVDNGCSKKSKMFLHQISENNSSVILVDLFDNTGSAKGFKKGIEEAIKITECNHVFLVDDDNVPRPGSINKLLTVLNDSDINSLVVAYRVGREPYESIAKGLLPKRIFSPPNAFLGFDILSKLKRCKIDNSEKSKDVRRSIEIPYGPFGGLMFHKSIINSIGLPDERYVLYCDDSDFTRRVYDYGGRVLLVPDAKMDDIDESWHDAPGNIFICLLNSNKNQLFFSVRNKVVFERRYFVKNKLQFYVNMLIYTSLLLYYAIVGRKMKSFRLFIQALKAGLCKDFSIKVLFN